MTMSTDLVIPNVGVNKYVTDEAFTALAKSADYLPRFQLYASSAKAVKRNLISGGHYGVQEGEKVDDYGTEVHCYVIGLRLKAMRIVGDKVETYFNPTHPEFSKIKLESGDKDSGSLCGPEYLLYIPSKKQFTTFFMANKTMRREASLVRTFMPTAEAGAKAMTLRVQLIEKGQYIWHGPIVTACSLPLDPPDMEELVKELERFNNPPEPKDVKATAAEAASQGNRAR